MTKRTERTSSKDKRHEEQVVKTKGTQRTSSKDKKDTENK